MGSELEDSFLEYNSGRADMLVQVFNIRKKIKSVQIIQILIQIYIFNILQYGDVLTYANRLKAGKNFRTEIEPHTRAI